MVSAKYEEIFGIFYLISQQKCNRLQRLFATVNVVTVDAKRESRREKVSARENSMQSAQQLQGQLIRHS